MAKIEHSKRKHALLSASGSERWLNCTPSAVLEAQIPEETTFYASEGTLAHEFGDISVKLASNQMTKRKYNAERKKLITHELYEQAMEDEVQKYVKIAIEAFREAQDVTQDAVILVEQKLDFSHIVKDGFGTGDTVIIGDGILEIIDLKYGKGVEVYASENSQLMLYGLGALKIGRAHV